MKISKIKIQNFRGYSQETIIDFSDLTAFIGKNDVGKSTILDALDIFLNESKTDKEDVNKECASKGDTDIIISVIFCDLPPKIIIDATNSTTLNDEYLLKQDGMLEVVKQYPNGGKEKIYINAHHPTNPLCSDLLLKKQSDLKKIIDKESIGCSNRTINAVMRKVIWAHYANNINCQEIKIDAAKEDAKKIWEKLREYMPLYSLFQSDRKNSDGDSEVQDPMKSAVKEILKQQGIQDKLNEIADTVKGQLKDVSDRTLEKLKEMDKEIADSLTPKIPSHEDLKWVDVFKNVSISGDEDIQINKRGSGVKRLVLLSFFRAEAERKRRDKNVPNIIYAIEEPETSQYPDYQRKIVDAFIALSEEENTQIILTTHSPSIVKKLKFSNLKLVKGKNNKSIKSIEKDNLPYPSLNEVNYLAFNEANEEYHNELYGYIESEELLGEFKKGKETKVYKRKVRETEKSEDKMLSEYIRHQIHHPENELNERFTSDQLKRSIDEMRRFITTNRG